MASLLTFHSFVFHCNLMQLGVLIDTKDVPIPVARAVVMPNKHGPNRFDDVWNMPPGKKLFLEINKAGQPVGKNSGSWARWLRIVARKPEFPLKQWCWEAIQVLGKKQW